MMTIFNTPGADVCAGVITWPERTAKTRLIRTPTADVIVHPIGWVQCDACPKRLELPMPDGFSVELPWKFCGWFVDWLDNDFARIVVRCPDHKADS